MKRSILTITVIFLLVFILGCSDNDTVDKDINSVIDEVPALMYHSIKPGDDIDEPSSMVVSKENFEQDLIFLSENGYTTISLEELHNYYENPDLDLPEKPIVITFDDGYADNYIYAYPLLKKYEAKASIFTIVWSVGRDKFILNDDPINPHFTWDQAREMVESGLVEIGSHTFDLHNPEGLSYGYEEPCGYGLGRMEGEGQAEYRERILGDLVKSKELIEENIGRQIKSFAYPYGIYDHEIIDLVKEAGFDLAFITEAKTFNPSPYTVRRFTVKDDLRVSQILRGTGF